MIEVTVKSLASKIQTSVERLIKQFADAGIYKSENDLVSQEEKEILLFHLNKNHINNSKKLTLKRKTKSIINIPCNGGKNKSINIEIRKKHTYVKNENFSEKKTLLQKKIKNKDNSLVKIELKKEIIQNKKIKNFKKKNKTDSKKLIFEKKETKYKKKIYKKSEKNSQKKEEKIKKIKKEKKHSLNNMIHEDTTNKYYFYSKQNKNKKKQLELKKNKEIYKSKIKIKKIKDNKTKIIQQNFSKPTQLISKNIIIGETITVAELANKMAIKSSQVIKSMMQMGFIVTINQIIDQDTAQLIAEELGHKVILHKENYLEEFILKDRDLHNKKEKRSPIVTIMGHVDHGKTTLLDCIRSTKIALNEIGGITQSIGAYHIKIKNKQGITFLDTPGHEAFTAMRARGTKITDIVVLVVAADDGLMPQTVEAIQHAQAASVPIIVAINKIDKPHANPKQIKNALSQYNIIPEEWGGDNIFVEISAKSNIGINYLIDAIILQSEILELDAVNLGMASGIVIESYLDKGKGPVANILVCEGTLKKGDIILCGFEYGRIRSIQNDLGQEIIQAGPSIPAKIFGLSGIPIAGDKFNIVRKEKKAREVAFYRQEKFREKKLANQQKNKFENIYSNIQTINTIKNNQNINILLKADVQGTIEAIKYALFSLFKDKILMKIIYSGVGNITETDVALANTASAMMLGFNVKINNSAKKIVKKENLDCRCYSIIYHLIADMKKFIEIYLKKDNIKLNILGLAEVRDVFKSPKFGTIAGCIVKEGYIQKNKNIKITRKNHIIYEGMMDSLRRFKDDVNEVKNGMECGISIKNYDDIICGDIIEVFSLEKTN